MPQPAVINTSTAMDGLANVLIGFAQGASIEANVHDKDQLESCASLIEPNTRMYVSHLPKQPWEDTCATSAVVKALGFNPVPHIPIRLIEDDRDLHTLLRALASQASIEEVLLISGDYPQSRGPYSAVVEVLKEFPFSDYGIKAVSLAGHPEGHPRVAPEVIREAEREKCVIAEARGLQSRLVTQFFFEAAPFLTWAHYKMQDNLSAQRIAGIAGPASLGTLFKFAMRCGVGPSLRALGVRPGSLLKLMGDYTPNELVLSLAKAKLQEPALFNGLHVFCFGGLARTCEWLHALANGQFELDADKGLRVHP